MVLSRCFESLTGELGQVFFQAIDGVLAQDDHAYHLLQSAAAGEISVKLTPMPNFEGEPLIELLDSKTLEVIASQTGVASPLHAPVNREQSVLVHVQGAVGNYRLELTNLDQYSVPGLELLHFPAGSFPSQEAVADFNGDGVLDVAIANAGSNHASILLGNGDGTFDAPRQFAVGAARYPNVQGVTFGQNGFRRAIVAADFNEDGFTDLSVTNYDSSDVSILLGRGDGTFDPQRRFNATSAPFGMTVGDVNRDGHMDLVVVDAALEVVASNMSVLLGRGDGSFEPQRVEALGNVLAAATPTLADLDRDGNLDLILSGGTGNGVDVLLGDGNGTFNLLGHFAGSRQSPDLVVADVDGDGHLDILAASLSAENTIWLLPGSGDGSFSQPKQYFVGQSPISLDLVDWGSVNAEGNFLPGEADGLLDIVVANAGTTQGVLLVGFTCRDQFLSDHIPVCIESIRRHS